jgi:hypothetical protein
MDHIHMRLQFAHDFEALVFLELRKHPSVFTDESRFQCRSDAHLVWKRLNEFSHAAMAPPAGIARISMIVRTEDQVSRTGRKPRMGPEQTEKSSPATCRKRRMIRTEMDV